MKRITTVQYQGLEPFDIEIATGQKGIDVLKLAGKVKTSENSADSVNIENLSILAEIIAKTTKFTKEEVIDSFTPNEILELSLIARGDSVTISQAPKA